MKGRKLHWNILSEDCLLYEININLMISHILVAILIVVGCQLYYSKVYLLKKKLDTLKQRFEEGGYTVKVEPFRVFGYPNY